MHVGIDTVTLKGRGFTPRVKVGDKVETGAPLIEFDLDHIATNAKSLLTEVIISNSDRVSRTAYGSGTASVGKTPVLTLTLNAAAEAPKEEAGPTLTSEAIVLPNPNGLHARPAAVLSSMAKTFQSDIRLQLGDRPANARSVTSLMALETALGDKVLLVAKGPDAREALDKLTPMIAKGLGDEGCVPASALATMTVAPIAAPAPLNPGLLRLIGQTVEGARKHDRFVGVCGGIAGDSQAVPILLGLGVDELSVSLPSIPTIKAQVRRLSYADCQALAQQALKCRTGDEVRAILPEA